MRTRTAMCAARRPSVCVLLLFSLLLSWAAFLAPAVTAKGIHATVQASWTETSLLQEGCEWASRVLGQHGFYACLDATRPAETDDADIARGARATSQAAQYELFLKRVADPWSQPHTTPMNKTNGSAPELTVSCGQRALLEVEMASRVYSPAVEVHYAMAERATAAAPMSEALLTVCEKGDPFLTFEDSGGRVVVVHDTASLEAAFASVRTSGGAAHDMDAAAIGLGVVPDLDHVHPSSAPSLQGENGEATAVVVLYGLVGEARTMAMYDAAVQMLRGEKAKLTLVFRHLPVLAARLCQSRELPHGASRPALPEREAWTARPLFVQGYGVTVDLKSMEYKTVDERKVGGQTGGSKDGAAGQESDAGFALQSAESGEVGGFAIPRLKERHPALAVQLDSFAGAMEDALGTEETKVDLDSVEAQNIALAAAQYVHEAKPEEKLAVLSDVVARFPTHAARLGKLATQSNRLSGLQSVAGLNLFRGIGPGGAIFVDGTQVMDKDTSLFGILERLRAEETFMDTVRQVLTARPPTIADDDAEGERGGEDRGSHPAMSRYVPLSGPGAEASLEATIVETQQRLQTYEAENPSTPPRLALPLDAFVWLNNIETAPTFQGLPKAMSTAFQVTAGGQRLMPRRNLVHLTFILDPASRWNYQLLSQVLQMLYHGVFVRAGFAFVDPDWQEARGQLHDTGSDFAAPSTISLLARTLTALVDLFAKEGNVSALARLLQALSMSSQQTNAPLTAEDVYSMATLMHLVDPEELSLTELLSDAEFQAFYHHQQSLLRSVGLAADGSAAPPTAFINGAKVSNPTDMRAVFELVMEENELVRNLISKKVLTDKTEDLHMAILAYTGFSDHFQPALDPEALKSFQFDSVALVDFLHLQPFLYPVESAAWGAFAQQGEGKKAKAPPVLTSTPTTSVLLLPSALDLASTARLLASAIAAHRTPPLPALSAKQQLSAHKKAQKSRKSTDAKRFAAIQGGGATRLTVLFPDAAASRRTGSVRWSVELLLEYDAKAMRETGRLSTALHEYVSWLLSALAAAEEGADGSDASTRSLRADDPSVEAVLHQLAPMPQSVKTALDKAAATGSESSADTRTRKLRACLPHVAAAVRKQLASAFGHKEGLRGATLEVPLLVLNGRVAFLEASATVTEEDLRFALRSGAGPASVVHAQLEQLNFAQLSAAAGVGFSSDDLDAAFYAAKVAALQSLVHGRVARHWVSQAGLALGVPEPLQADAVLPPVEAAGGLAFTMEPPTAGNAPGASSQVVDGTSRSRHHIALVVDPAARQSQLLVALGEFFLKSPLGVRLTVYMNPSQHVSRPIRNLFTYVASPTLRFDARTGSVVAPAGVFRALPTQAILTLGIEEPSSWTVFSHEAEYDLDNIILAKLPKHRQFVSAAYRIHSILVAGSALKILSGGGQATYANGLPLTLRPLPSSTADSGARQAPSASRDTLVMQSVGYYQLQASVGLFHLSIQPGPFAAAYYIAGFDDDMHKFSGPYAADALGNLRHPLNASAGQRLPLLITTFNGLSLDMYVAPVPSAQGQPHILAIAEREANASRRVWPPQPLPDGSMDRPTRPAKPTLNIFSVASGHLYERFLRMMMYSVHTASSDKFGANTTRIKFWVIENFLSPQFKAYIPLMADHFGFEVGFVTYRWPWWLQRQTEKQRKIWAYKILFLDVLFPLDVDRVIFVDADQTDRADLHELYNMDIGGRPVAMTPFCEAHKNEATTGFRFWAQGFWTRHLAGSPYHISAIFLIDLHRFRAMGAGDVYRGTYAQLVQDPNSLANLDQDLPNYVQRQVPIFSLPEEWLWCETWCDEASKAAAKTIDLCNNPLTKMPKLNNAKMIVPHWEETDDMLEDLASKLFAEQEAKEAAEAGVRAS